jgi:L-cysteine S-thiosulfotransferase
MIAARACLSWLSGTIYTSFGLFFSLCVNAQTAPWPTDSKLSGNAFLSPGLLKIQNDIQDSPVSLWLDKGQQQWADNTGGASCKSCHGTPETLKNAVPTFPHLVNNAQDKGPSLINLEDQIVACRNRAGRTGARAEDDDVLSLSALLHNTAKGLPINVAPLSNAEHTTQWQGHLERGAALFSKRMGRINLACVNCHEQNVGKQMRVDVVSPGHPTGFPIYRMSWQKVGSMDRRLRACYSGVQAVIPPAGAPELRDLELYLKVRANGMPLEGPSIRR